MRVCCNQDSLTIHRSKHCPSLPVLMSRHYRRRQHVGNRLSTVTVAIKAMRSDRGLPSLRSNFDRRSERNSLASELCQLVAPKAVARSYSCCQCYSRRLRFETRNSSHSITTQNVHSFAPQFAFMLSFQCNEHRLLIIKLTNLTKLTHTNIRFTIGTPMSADDDNLVGLRVNHDQAKTCFASSNC